MRHVPRTLSLARAGLLAATTMSGLVAACTSCEKAEQRQEAGATEGGAETIGAMDTDAPRESAADGESASLAEATDIEDIDVPDPPGSRVRRRDASGPDANREIFSDYGFPGHPGLLHLCGRRDLLPGGQRLMWDAFASEQPPSAVIAHFKRRLGERGFAAAGPGGAWRLPPGSPAPERILEITPVSAPGRHRSCDRRPAPETKTVIVLIRQ